MQVDQNITNGTVGGTLIALIATLDPQDVVKTVFLAAIGAIISFMMSKLLKWCWENLKR